MLGGICVTTFTGEEFGWREIKFLPWTAEQESNALILNPSSIPLHREKVGAKAL